VGSANLWFGRADPDALVALVERHSLDVLAAQELGHEQAEALSCVLPHGRLDPRSDASGLGIAARYPLEVERVPLAWQDLFVGHLDPGSWPGLVHPVEFATTHLAAPHVRPLPLGPWFRFKQVRDLGRYLAAQGAARRVLVGDFNATPLWPAYRRIACHLTDAAVAVAQGRGRPPRATWGPGAAAPRLLRIDHAFSRGLRPEAFEVVDVAGSDHSAIVIEFSF